MASLSTWGNTLIGQDDYVNRAANRARAQYDAGINSAIRQAGRMGINPSSGAFMNMLNNAQYERTAGMNAAANEADYQWLNAAQKQFNADRDFGLQQQRLNNANNQWWASFGAARNAEKARYAHERGMFDKWLNREYGPDGQSGSGGQKKSPFAPSLQNSANYSKFNADADNWDLDNLVNVATWDRRVARNPYRWQYGDGVNVDPYRSDPGYRHPFNKSWRGGM